MIYFNNFSLSMLTNTTHKIEIKKIKKEDFLKTQNINRILNQDIQYNNLKIKNSNEAENILLKKGDELYTKKYGFGRKNTSYPKEDNITYEKIKVIS